MPAGHGGATREHDVTIDTLANLNITLQDILKYGVMDTNGFLDNAAALEEHLSATETLTSNRNDVPLWDLASLLSLSELSPTSFISVSKSRAV